MTVCTRCVLDTSDPDITFDSEGVCNHCRKAESLLPNYRFTEEESEQRLKAIAGRIRVTAGNQPYDSILGLSGGVDSSYVAHLAHKIGLKPLVVHFDNGWNSEMAVANIEKIVQKCNYDLMTYVIDWPEFRDIQRAFFKAGVIDIEMVTDHAILAIMYRLARKHKIKYVLSGTNFATEHGMPRQWLWNKADLTNLKAIHKKYGELKIKSYPTMSTLEYVYRRFMQGLEYVELLNNVNYTKQGAMDTLRHEFDWQYYGGKHYESVFTKFYQAYVLPTKFKVDKRRVHLSDLIRNGEITRDDALAELALPLYTDNELRNDKLYVCRKLGFSEEELDRLIAEAPVPHGAYPSDQWLVNLMRRTRDLVRPKTH